MTSKATLVSWVAIGVALTGCGTRLPDSAFRSHQAVPTTTATPSPTPTGGTANAEGVSASTITIGTITSLSNPFDRQAFAGPLYGLRAFVDDINRRGGINGRRLILKTCDDGGNGGQNVVCVKRLIDQERVFALVSSAILNYAGASYVNQRSVPDIGGQPVDIAYTKYHHLWDVTGESYPREGEVGWSGQLVGSTDVYRYFKVKSSSQQLRAGVVYYNQVSSKRYGEALVRGLRREGYSVTTAEVNFALPDYDSAVIKFRQAGVRYVYDAIDRTGNERLCKAIDDNRLTLVAKVTTTQGWDASIGSEYAASPRCRNVLYATGGSRNFDEVRHPAVAAFRQGMARLGYDTTQDMSQWALEGWAGARWFADAVASCGATVTRACVERYMARSTAYDAGGLLLPRDFTVTSQDVGPHRSCLSVARWQDSANGGRGGWVSQQPDMTSNCFIVPSIRYSP